MTEYTTVQLGAEGTLDIILGEFNSLSLTSQHCFAGHNALQVAVSENSLHEASRSFIDALGPT